MARWTKRSWRASLRASLNYKGEKPMQFVCESARLEDYLAELDTVNYSHPAVQDALSQLAPAPTDPDTERARKAFVFVRDQIHHSWDIQSTRVTCRASDVLRYGTGLCYAKAHLLAALLRAQGIPTGFCYQRLTLGDTPESGYALHGLNAVYLASAEQWIRLDARGNKPGVHSEFSLDEERLAYVVQPALGEIDYPTIYARPYPTVVHALQSHTNCLDLCEHFLPEYL
jgi:transglutaminase-like putative cysteine protease